MTAISKYQVASLEVTNNWLNLVWADGHLSQYPGVWLLEACVCARCGDSATAVRHISLHEKPVRPQIEACSFDNDQLTIDWGDQHHSVYALQWLRDRCLSAEARSERKFQAKPWGREMLASLPYFDYPEVVASPERHLQFLESILDSGFAILRKVPSQRKCTEDITSLVGKLRMTNYGIYELESKPDPEIVGDMAISINLHTDEPYRVDPPGITFFHVIKQADSGGASTLTDSFRLAQDLRERHPDDFKILSRIAARFHRDLIEGRIFEYQRPIIQCDNDGDINGVYLLDRGMAPVDCALDEVEPFYDALRRFLQTVDTDQDAIEFRLQTGEMLVFNNHRLMHGRTAFDPSSGRHVRSCHVDLDEFHSRLRIEFSERNDPRRWMTFRKD